MINHGKNLVLTYPIISTTGKCCQIILSSTKKSNDILVFLNQLGVYIPNIREHFGNVPKQFLSPEEDSYHRSKLNSMDHLLFLTLRTENQSKCQVNQNWQYQKPSIFLVLSTYLNSIFRNASRISSGHDAPRISTWDASGNAAWNASNARYAAWYASTGNDASWFPSRYAATWVSWYASRQ